MACGFLHKAIPGGHSLKLLIPGRNTTSLTVGQLKSMHIAEQYAASMQLCSRCQRRRPLGSKWPELISFFCTVSPHTVCTWYSARRHTYCNWSRNEVTTTTTARRLATLVVASWTASIKVSKLRHILPAHAHSLADAIVRKLRRIGRVKVVPARLHQDCVLTVLGEGSGTIMHDGHDIIRSCGVCTWVLGKLTIHTLLDVVPHDGDKAVAIGSRLLVRHSQGMEEFMGCRATVVATRGLQIQFLIPTK